MHTSRSHVGGFRNTEYLSKNVRGYGIFGRKIDGMWDMRFGDIEHKSWRYKPPELTEYRIFRPKINVLRDLNCVCLMILVVYISFI